MVYKQILSGVSIMRDDQSLSRLDSIDAYIEVLRYTVPKGYYNVALMDFGEATRRLLFYSRKYTDELMRSVMKTQYQKLSAISKEIEQHFDLKIKLRMWLFRRNLTVYGIVRDAFAH